MMFPCHHAGGSHHTAATTPGRALSPAGAGGSVGAPQQSSAFPGSSSTPSPIRNMTPSSSQGCPEGVLPRRVPGRRMRGPYRWLAGGVHAGEGAALTDTTLFDLCSTQGAPGAYSFVFFDVYNIYGFILVLCQGAQMRGRARPNADHRGPVRPVNF